MYLVQFPCLQSLYCSRSPGLTHLRVASLCPWTASAISLSPALGNTVPHSAFSSSVFLGSAYKRYAVLVSLSDSLIWHNVAAFATVPCLMLVASLFSRASFGWHTMNEYKEAFVIKVVTLFKIKVFLSFSHIPHISVFIFHQLVPSKVEDLMI